MKKILIQAISFMAFIFVTTFEAECKNDVDLGECFNQCTRVFNLTCQHIISTPVRKGDSKLHSIESCTETPLMNLKNCLQKC